MKDVQKRQKRNTRLEENILKKDVPCLHTAQYIRILQVLLYHVLVKHIKTSI